MAKAIKRNPNFTSNVTAEWGEPGSLAVRGVQAHSEFNRELKRLNEEGNSVGAWVDALARFQNNLDLLFCLTHENVGMFEDLVESSRDGHGASNASLVPEENPISRKANAKLEQALKKLSTAGEPPLILPGRTRAQSKKTLAN